MTIGWLVLFVLAGVFDSRRIFDDAEMIDGKGRLAQSGNVCPVCISSRLLLFSSTFQLQTSNCVENYYFLLSFCLHLFFFLAYVLCPRSRLDGSCAGTGEVNFLRYLHSFDSGPEGREKSCGSCRLVRIGLRIENSAVSMLLLINSLRLRN